MATGKSDQYTKAGVDISAAAGWVSRIGNLASKVKDESVLSGIGGFSGLYSMEAHGFGDLVLASGADGVGTKLLVAQMAGKHDTVGIDLVAMNVDDIVTSGAKPLFFMDYIAGGDLTPSLVEEIVSGVIEGCHRAGCVLLGGETAQMPGLYGPGQYDLAGFSVGAVVKDRIIDGKNTSCGDVILGFASSGLHSNGYSLARHVFLEKAKWDLNRYVDEFGRTLEQELLEPTFIYAPFMLKLMDVAAIKGAAHITGGGVTENIPRILPPGLGMELSYDWEVPAVFKVLQSLGRISEEEMYRVFNMGVGMTVIVSQKDAEKVLEFSRSAGISSFVAGEIIEQR